MLASYKSSLKSRLAFFIVSLKNQKKLVYFFVNFQDKPKPQTIPKPASSQPPNGTNGSGFKMKLKKVKKKKIAAAEKPPEVDPRDKIPKAYMDFSDDEEPKTKLPKLDHEQDQEPKLPDLFENFLPEPMVPPAPPPIAVAPVPAVPEPQVDPLQQAVLAAKAKIESLLPTQSSSNTGKNISLKKNQIQIEIFFSLFFRSDVSQCPPQ